MNEALSLAGLFSAPDGNHVAGRLRGWNFLLAQENSGLVGRLCSAARAYPPYESLLVKVGANQMRLLYSSPCYCLYLAKARAPANLLSFASR